ncbi:MAG: DMT family transporter [Candidatus Bipolaricaulota bacterium]
MGVWGTAMVALAAGAAIAVQSSLSGIVGTRIGVLGSSLVIHAAGLAFAIGLAALWPSAATLTWKSIPWLALPAGLVGVGIVAAVSYAVPRLGLGTTLTLTIAAQLALGAALDHLGWLGAPHHPLSVGRAIGYAAIVVGTWLVVR